MSLIDMDSIQRDRYPTRRKKSIIKVPSNRTMVIILIGFVAFSSVTIVYEAVYGNFATSVKYTNNIRHIKRKINIMLTNENDGLYSTPGQGFNYTYDVSPISNLAMNHQLNMDSNNSAGLVDEVTKTIPHKISHMVLNATISVKCKKSPYVECFRARPIVKTQRMFNVSLLRRPRWFTSFTHDVIKKCPFNQCQFTEDVVTMETDVVVVNGVGLRDEHKPKQRWPHQLYVLSFWESPDYTDSTSSWNTDINLTTSYRTDSDIFVPYSKLAYRPKPLKKRPNYYEIAKSKTGTAYWFVSHCKTTSKREEYVKEMKKYIDVDIYGRCGQPCSQKNSTCDNLSSRYKFYLSFENSLCTDYVTEKFFKMFVTGNHAIPVVRGGADYEKYFPRFTFINAANFKTAKDLALYLKSFASDLEAYSKYLEYKDMYVKKGYVNLMGCILCEYLHTQNLSKAKTNDLKSWAFDKKCHSRNDF